MKRSISSVLFLASLALIGQVNSVAFDLVKQYSECKNLVMIEYIDSWQHYYYPDPTVENNNLDDSYYQSLGLADLSVNDALDAIQQIYQEMANDASVFECVNNRQYNWYATVNSQTPMYAAFFTDENLPDVKQIISSLDSALADDLRPSEELQWFWGFGSGLNLPTLTNFSYVGEFSSLRNNEYRSFYDCYSFNFSTWLACSYYAKVDLDNREVSTERTSDYLEKMLLCQVMPLNQCIQEKKLFYGLTSWAEGFSDLDLSGQSLLSYFEALAETAENIELDSFDSVYVSVWDQTAYYKAYKTSWSQADLSLLGSSISLLSSDSLNIVAEIDSGSDRQTSVKKLSISTNNGVELNIDECSIKDLQNTTLTNSNGENEIQIIFYDYSQYNYYYIEAYHFDSRTTLSFAKSYFSISGPTSFFDSASGFLIDGPPQNDNKKIENKMECKTMCKNAAKSMEKVRSVHNLALEKNTARCMNSC